MLKSRKGMAMLIVISLVLMLLILGGAVLVISTGHFGTSFQQIRRARAFYAAEAAMQEALWKCRTGVYDLVGGESPTTITISDPNYTMGVTVTVSAPNAEGINTIDATVDY